ncbi:MAG: PEP-CTERM sorting domain-containing protein, partial [Novosphingobium sp.]
HADWISVDTAQGPGTAVLDTGTGLTWLKLSVTENWTIGQVESATSAGGVLENYRYANGSELNCGLLPNYFNLATPCAGGFVTLGNAATVEQFFDLFGFFSSQRYRFAYFELRPRTRIEGRDAFVSDFFRYDTPVPHYEYDSQLITVQMEQAGQHWLVAEAQAVPEPNIALLLGAGAFGLMAMRRKSGRQGR